MKYFVSSDFVSLVCATNIALFAVLPVVRYPGSSSNEWRLSSAWQVIISFCGILFNCFVVLESRRKLESIKKKMGNLRRSAFNMLKQKLESLYRYIGNFMNALSVFSDYLESFYDYTGVKRLLACVARSSKAVNSCIGNRNAVKEENFSTPDANGSQVIKGIKAYSDPVKNIKLTIKEKYLPGQSPELFKNKIYLTRRNLTQALE